MLRRVFQRDVVRARRTDKISIASPRDFGCGKALALHEQPQHVLPYCIDFLQARAIYVDVPHPPAVQAAPFYYLHLRRQARTIVSVPLEQTCMRGTSCAPPVFLFSPGRCGSTLLSRLFHEAGVASVSEPDFYTQLATPFWSGPARSLRGPFRRAMWSMTSDLCAALGQNPVVKLRAECCAAPDLFLRTGRQRTLVMFRRFEDWVRSTAQVFGAGPTKAVRKYMRALACYGILRNHSDCLAVQYEQLTSEPEKACAALGGFLGRVIEPAALARAAAHNAQAGTPLESRRRPGWEARFDGAMQLWNSPRMVRARDLLGLPDVWN